MRRIACMTVTAACMAAATPAAAAPRISVAPNPVDHDQTQTVKGRGWPVIEFCKRRVRIRLLSDQNAVLLGFARVRASGRFRLEWSPDGANVGAGDWRLVVRMRCESGEDGSPNPQRRAKHIRVR
jgi:hypothetical protein